MNTLTKTLLCALVALPLALAAPAADARCTNPTHDDVTFKIKRKRHKSKPHGVRKWSLKKNFDRQLHFQVRFFDDVAYRTKDPQNQHDWNKLLGFTSIRIHKNSIRTGWRYDVDSGEVELGFYGYLNKQRTFKQLASIPIGTWADVSIQFWNGGMRVTINGVSHEETGDMGLPNLPISTWMLRTAYFGGDEKAPQTIRVDVRDIVLDEACQL